jgi:hypothetical protein
MSNLSELRRLFAELADNLAALKKIYANDPASVRRLEFAQQRAKYGADLAGRGDRAEDGAGT